MRILERLGAVKKRISLGETAIRQLMANGEFPQPIKLGSAPNSPLAWPSDEIDRWIDAQIEKSRSQQGR